MGNSVRAVIDRKTAVCSCPFCVYITSGQKVQKSKGEKRGWLSASLLAYPHHLSSFLSFRESRSPLSALHRADSMFEKTCDYYREHGKLPEGEDCERIAGQIYQRVKGAAINYSINWNLSLRMFSQIFQKFFCFWPVQNTPIFKIPFFHIIVTFKTRE